MTDLDRGRGAQIKVGMFGSAINSSGKNSPVTDLTLNVAIRQFGNIVSNLSVTVPSDKVADNTSLSDLASDLTEAIKTINIPGLPIIDGIPPVEVQASDGKLYLLANSIKVNGLTITGGLHRSLVSHVNQVSNVPDLAIKLRNGNTVNVDLDFSETLGDIKTKIEAAAPTIAVTFFNDQLQLKDNSVPLGDQ